MDAVPFRPIGSSRSAYDAGYEAGVGGVPHEENPHTKHGRLVPGVTIKLSSWWSAGWYHGKSGQPSL